MGALAHIWCRAASGEDLPDSGGRFVNATPVCGARWVAQCRGAAVDLVCGRLCQSQSGQRKTQSFCHRAGAPWDLGWMLIIMCACLTACRRRDTKRRGNLRLLVARAKTWLRRRSS